MLRRALRYPLGRGRRLDVLALGTALHLATVWVPLVPLVPVLGYLLRVLRTTADRNGADPVPGFGDPVALLADGLRATVVVAAYAAAPLALLLLAVRGPVDAPTGAPGTGTALAFLALSTATLTLSLAVVAMLPAALTNVAATGRLRSAFDLGVLRRAATDGEYVVAALFGVALLGAGVGVARALTDWVVGFALAFYVEVATAALVGRASGRAVRGAGETDCTNEADGGSGTDGANDGAAAENGTAGREPQETCSNSSR